MNGLKIKQKIKEIILMVFFYVYRSVPCPAAMKEAFSGSRWKQMQTTPGRHYVESDSKLGVTFRDLPSGNSAEEEIER